MSDRETFTSREVSAGCFVCGGSDPRWFGPQAQGTAARHHDVTGHPTWCDVYMTVRYGRELGAGEQLELEAAIAGAAG